MFNTLSVIAENLNKANITWAIGASMILCIHGLVEKPNDIDIIVSLNDIQRADTIFSSLGKKFEWEKSDSYSSKHFYEYKINNIDVDVIAGLRINLENEVFEYNFTRASITKYHLINNIKIPMTSLEDWFILYQLMQNRDPKVTMIETYLLNHKIDHLEILKQSLEYNIPNKVKSRTLKLIENSISK